MFPRINFAGKVQTDAATANNVFSNFDINTFAPVDLEVNEVNWNPSGTNNFRLIDVAVTRACIDEASCVYLRHQDPIAEAQINGTVSFLISF